MLFAPRSLGVTSFQRSCMSLFSSLRKQQIQELGWVSAPPTTWTQWGTVNEEKDVKGGVTGAE